MKTPCPGRPGRGISKLKVDRPGNLARFPGREPVGLCRQAPGEKMELFNILAVLLTLTALFSYLNLRCIGLPTTIGVMFIALVLSLTLVLAGVFEPGIKIFAQALVDSVHFDKTLLHGILSYLLFAGALHVNLNDLYANRRIIGFLAIFGTLISVGILGLLTWGLLRLLEIEIPFIFCLLFGALISPTDPIAVLGILKTAGAPKSLETKITGESLFNDGVGLVLFLLILNLATGRADGESLSLGPIALFFVQEALGGIVFGLLIGYIAYKMLQSIDNYSVEILITLALVSGGYALATALHLSGPLAIVVAGLFIGNQGRLFAMSDETTQHLDLFWELVDDILNAVLFVLIGLEALTLTFRQEYLLAGTLAIPMVLFARFIAVGIPVTLLRKTRSFSPGVIRILTWGGLRGGISVALALSLPVGAAREIILTMTYCVVIFSILVQGLTIGSLIKKLSVE